MNFVFTLVFILVCVSILTYLSDFNFDNVLLIDSIVLFSFFFIILNQKRVVEISYSKEGIQIVCSKWFKREKFFIATDSLRITKERRVKARGTKVWLHVIYKDDVEVFKVDWKSGFSEKDLNNLKNIIHNKV